jgi:glycosyltransferase involved in cell wall biosynthesis
MPYVMLEAFGFGKPVLGANLGGIPERIKVGENGFLFEAGNAESLADTVRTFNALDRATLSQNAWESIQTLTGETYLRALQMIYKKAIASVDESIKK